MSYTKKKWINRLAERSDLSSKLVHLTRETDDQKTNQVLLSILGDRKIIGSTTEKGFICGNTPAVCFQDAPLSGICQNVYFEQKMRAGSSTSKVRYRATGLAFNKGYAFKRGARPVVYDKTAAAKEYLPKDQHWRIVNFDLDNEDRYIDWTHEREWRKPGSFEFDIENVTLLFVRDSSYKNFINLCKKSNLNYLEKVEGVVVMSNILY